MNRWIVGLALMVFSGALFAEDAPRRLSMAGFSIDIPEVQAGAATYYPLQFAFPSNYGLEGVPGAAFPPFVLVRTGTWEGDLKKYRADYLKYLDDAGASVLGVEQKGDALFIEYTVQNQNSRTHHYEKHFKRGERFYAAAMEALSIQFQNKPDELKALVDSFDVPE